VDTLPSAPVAWFEVEAVLKRKSTKYLAFESPDVLKRVKKQGDLFKPVLTLKQKLPRPGSGNDA
jgi:bifunctional non-homologous end joining protein LigD